MFSCRALSSLLIEKELCLKEYEEDAAALVLVQKFRQEHLIVPSDKGTLLELKSIVARIHSDAIRTAAKVLLDRS